MKPAFYRKRTTLIKKLLKQQDDDLTTRQLRGGVIPASLIPKGKTADQFITSQTGEFSNGALTFTEKTSFSTFFAIHPEKIAGKEELSSSIHFPITIKGDKKDIIQTIEKTLKGSPNQLILKAKALKLKLQLLKL